MHPVQPCLERRHRLFALNQHEQGRGCRSYASVHQLLDSELDRLDLGLELGCLARDHTAGDDGAGDTACAPQGELGWDIDVRHVLEKLCQCRSKDGVSECKLTLSSQRRGR